MGLSLHLDWCDRKAATYAAETWHPSKTMPTGASNRVGVWEEGDFRACLIFTRAEQVAAAQFGLTRLETVELARFARWKLKTPFSRLIKIALGFVRDQNPGARMIVTFVDDPNVGVCFQAAGWYYLGKILPGSRNRHAYARPLDRDARLLLENLTVPYPRRQAAVEAS